MIGGFVRRSKYKPSLVDVIGACLLLLQLCNLFWVHWSALKYTASITIKRDVYGIGASVFLLYTYAV